MKLLLTSQGLPKELSSTFLSLLEKKPEETRVLFVTTAAYGEDENPTWLGHYRNELQSYGIESIEELDVRGKTYEDLKKVDTDIIFINGGNTFYLLHWIRESGFDRIIKEFVKEGKLYIGVSAGSYIVCPTIEAAGWKGADKIS